MLVRFLCPACHQLLGIAPRKVGAQVNCPKCGATILVPDPEEPHAAETSEPSPAADDVPTDFLTGDAGPADVAATDELPNDELPNDAVPNDAVPNDAVGADVLGDAYDRLSVSSPPSHSVVKRRPHSSPLLDDEDRIVISRRVIYFQAALLAIVGVLALLAGYLIGSGSRLHGP